MKIFCSKWKYLLLGLPILMIIMACPISQDITDIQNELEEVKIDIDNDSDGSLGIPSIETDITRNQGIFITAEGEKIDISSEEYQGGPIVNCIEAIDMTVLATSTELSSRSISVGTGDSSEPSLIAIVIGRRGDGKPGAWAILSDNSVFPITMEGSRLQESEDRESTIKGFLGWEYELTTVSSDGKIIVGYAINKDGYENNRWSISPGTTVGVYWRIRKSSHAHYFHVTWARVIGVPPEFKKPDNPHRRRIYRFFRFMWKRLQLFFYNWYETYLIMADSIEDVEEGVYKVYGKNQDQKAAFAIINQDGVEKIEEYDPGGGGGEVDLSPGDINLDIASVADGQNISGVTIVVKNLNSGIVSDSFVVEFKLSQSSSFDPANDETIGLVDVTSDIQGNSEINIATDLLVSDLNINQSVYIYAIVDPADEVTETDEANNQSAENTSPSILVYDDEDSTRTYDLIMETFPPAGSGSTNTLIAVYKENGTTAAFQIDDDDSSTFALYSRIIRSMDPGTYYLLAIAYSPGGPYAFSARTDNIDLRFFGTGSELGSNAEDPGENDDYPTSLPFPWPATIDLPSVSTDIVVGSGANRYLAENDYDWFKVVLP